MEENHINFKDEYKKLGYKENNNSNFCFRKIKSERKLTSGILKRKTRKQSHFVQKEKGFNSSIKWDDKIIEEQKEYRKNHPLDKEKFKNSIAKYASSVVDNNDVYIKGLNKVNQINTNDELFCKIYNALSDNISGRTKILKRNRSCLTIGKYKKIFNLQTFYNLTEKEKIFDESLGEEQKLTLQNTLYNKINKNVGEK